MRPMPFDLLLVRHAAAVGRGTVWPDDDRWLTERGRRRFRKVVRRLRDRIGADAPEVILTSPLPRAVMTAELLRAGLPWDVPVEVQRPLAAEGALGPALTLLRGEGRRAALVGHEPLLGALLGALCGPGVPATLRKGAVALLRRRGDGYRLVDLIAPGRS